MADSEYEQSELKCVEYIMSPHQNHTTQTIWGGWGDSLLVFIKQSVEYS